MSDLSLSPLLELETSIAPLPDRLRLLAEAVEGDTTAYPEAIAALLLECAATLDAQLARLRAHCRLQPAPEVAHA